MEECACRINENQFRAFLQKSKKDSENISDFTEVHVILGNNTCDLDSCACSLAYAYLLHVETVEKQTSKIETVIPVLNVKFSEVRTRTEVCYILDLMEIPLELIVTRTDIDLNTLGAQKKLKMTLVDHHQLESSDAHLEESVVRVIDHRPVNRAWRLPANMITIEQVGSCSTLVAATILKQKLDSLLTFPPQIFQLLYGAIVLDTMNFSDISKRATIQDVQISTKIESSVTQIGQMTRDQVYDALLRARCNVSGLSTLECLLKDFKITYGIPVCTLTTLVQEFIQKSDTEEALCNLQLEFESEGVLLIGISIHGGHLQRDIGIFSATSTTFASQVSSGLQQCDELNLGLIQLPIAVIRGLTIFTQSNQKKTRKHILPVLQQILKEGLQM